MYKGFNNRKEYLYHQQNGRCYYCEEKTHFKKMTKEHLHRRADGGTNCEGNIVLACGPCNSHRGDLPPEVWKLVRGDVISITNDRRINQSRPYRFIKNTLFKRGIITNEKLYHRLLSFNNRYWKPLVIKYYRLKKDYIIWKAYRTVDME